MGITHFFGWFKNTFTKNITKIDSNKSVIEHKIETLMIDMNGLIHTSTQKIYAYGDFRVNKRILVREKNIEINYKQKNLEIFIDVCKSIDTIFNMVKPTKKVILCIDGPAPLSKQNQQRQRRFKSAYKENADMPFDRNSITPGTEFMDELTKYIDYYILGNMMTDNLWKNISVIFSSEKAPGEGEHKLINYIRKYGKDTEKYCIHGMDADLIMLALATHKENFYILRQDTFNGGHYFINIGEVRKELAEILSWKSENFIFDKKSAINDFVFLCFMIGNDFLPHIPSIEIVENGIELIFNVYKAICPIYGHITKINDDLSVHIIPSSLCYFLKAIGDMERVNMEKKLLKNSYFKDELLESCAKRENNYWNLDIIKYKKLYLEKLFPKDISIEKICLDYFDGMQWVLSYYTNGVPDWKWQYPYHYAPLASILCEYADKIKSPVYKETFPSTPFQQLLCVLPPKSANLIPYPLSSLLTDKSSRLNKFCPEDFEIDLSGKKNEWQGIVILPIVDFNIVVEEYNKVIDKVNPRELKRNVIGKTICYKYDDSYCSEYKSKFCTPQICNIRIKYIKL